MEARADLPPKPRGGGKVNNEQGQRRNRRVLGDIGNLEVFPIADGKQISRPITRGFHAQLLKNAQAEAEKKKNPVVPVMDDKVAIQRKSGPKKVKEAQKHAIDRPKPETKAVVSFDEDEKVKPLNGRKTRERSSRKEIKTLTAILTARSKAACGVVLKPESLIVNIDAGDVNNDLAAVEYVDDIYKFYKLTEDDSQVHDYMDSQPEINVKMRAILIDWLIEVHRRFELMPETLYLTINLIDRYLSTNLESFSLSGVSCFSLQRARTAIPLRCPSPSFASSPGDLLHHWQLITFAMLQLKHLEPLNVCCPAVDEPDENLRQLPGPKKRELGLSRLSKRGSSWNGARTSVTEPALFKFVEFRPYHLKYGGWSIYMLFYEARTLSLLLFGACNIKVQTGLDSIVILTSSWHGLTVFLDRTKTQVKTILTDHIKLSFFILAVDKFVLNFECF